MQIPPLDLKQVELIKGSSSTLYGGGAIAGLVNLITIMPEDDPELSIMLNLTSALGVTGNAFRVVAPTACQRTAFEKDGCTDARSVADGIFFYVKYFSSQHK